MRHGLVFSSLTLLVLTLALAPAAVASNTWYVDGVNGNDANDCKSLQTACKTIGHAISLASSGDTISAGPATYTENLTIGFSLTLIGSRAAPTIIDGGGVNAVVTISNWRDQVTLSILTIRNGYEFYRGGGISNGGTLTINNSTISGNGSVEGGGGIYNANRLTINNSTIAGNYAAPYGVGGGILNDGGRSNGGWLTINNSTIAGNSVYDVQGGGIYNDGGTATLQNSIVANNRGGNCGTYPVTSNGYNLSSDTTCNFNNTGDLNNTNPKLGHLGNWGGPTQTMLLPSGSPAIDAGNPAGCTDGRGHLLKTDQRGAPRPDKEDTGGCDIGAFERGTPGFLRDSVSDVNSVSTN